MQPIQISLQIEHLQVRLQEHVSAGRNKMGLQKSPHFVIVNHHYVL